ncbi:hypothetical protein [Terriglobus roseus]|uniref:Uncharacterized protein n=1 Tax=Terriglobus roseus TaxID=392734 RepID=A0A1H4J0A5_9BACT|nr:hypothetical protein [Terriglobus roseus]SEB39048.1 hypothetical protein SAMN05443244_0204 [Terriglobus roseus]
MGLLVELDMHTGDEGAAMPHSLAKLVVLINAFHMTAAFGASAKLRNDA